MESPVANALSAIGLALIGVMLAGEGWKFFLLGCGEKKNKAVSESYTKGGLIYFLLGIMLLAAGTSILLITTGDDRFLIEILSEIVKQKYF